MVVSADYNNQIHISLKSLMAEKSARDGVTFTTYQLAKLLDMPKSILVRLAHPDPSKRVNNPRIDTLTRIVDFFKNDGFDVTIDDLLMGRRVKPRIGIQSQDLGLYNVEKTVFVYSFNPTQKDHIGTIVIKLTHDVKNVIALLSDEDLKPMFKKGSIFIVDMDLEPRDDTLVAVKIDGHEKILIKKFYIRDNKKLLESFDNAVKVITLTPKLHCSILGVVIQVNVKT